MVSLWQQSPFKSSNYLIYYCTILRVGSFLDRGVLDFFIPQELF